MRTPRPFGMAAGLCAALCAALLATPGRAGPAQDACRQALALGMDVSGSVDAAEYRLQVDGLAAALQDPGVAEAFLAMPGADVMLAVFEWSGPEAQRLILPWTRIGTAADLERVAGVLRATERGLHDPSTAIGSAKAHGAALLAQQSGCWRPVLDLSGDGMSNTGPRPGDVRPAGMTVNGLVIAHPEDLRREPGVAELTSYFRAYVLEGPDAFVETALGFDDFEAAMIRKLKRELQVMVLGAVAAPADQ